MDNSPQQSPHSPPMQSAKGSVLEALHRAAAQEVKQLLTPNNEGRILQLAGAAGSLAFDEKLPFAGQVLVSMDQEISGWAKIHAGDSILPVGSNSMAAVLVVHILDYQKRPDLLIDEVERVLDAEGQLVICGFNPWSLCNLM